MRSVYLFDLQGILLRDQLCTACIKAEKENHDSSVSIALGYGMDDQDSRVLFLVGAGNFSLYHCIQPSSGAHSASYPMGSRVSFPGGEVARA
jgi:hypothetical protein